MPVDYTAKWQPLDGSAEFLFVPPYKEEYWSDPDRISFRVPTADTPGDGEASGDGSAEARTVTIGGLLAGETEDEFLSRWDALNAGVRGGVLGRLYKSTERFLLCRMTSLQRPRDIGLEYAEWEMAFRASDPFYYSATVFTQALTQPGSTVVAIGGTYSAVPVLVLTVSSIGTSGTVTVTSTTNGVVSTFVLRPSATGVYTIDNAAGTVLRGGVDAIANFSGEFFENVGPTNATISITLASGATLSAASIQWRKRYTGA